MSYTWDAKGNMLTRTGSTYEWNEDNRLVHAYISGGDPKTELYQKFFKYDYAGRRILEYKNTDGIRKRSFFNGLTEEIKKVSVGTGADTSFARTVQITSASTETGWVNWGVNSSHQWDADRLSDVTHLTGEDALGKAYWESGNGWDIQGKRTFAIWAKTPSSGSVIAINYIDTASNRRLIAYVPGTGTDYTSGAEGFIYLGGTAQDFDGGGWVRIERDLQSDITARFSGTTLQRVTGIYARPGTSSTLDIDDLSFSNSLTVEHNTLGGGVIGHILRNRSTNVATYAATDRWFHYDQVGSVMSETDSSGALAQTHHQDAFGNTQASWSTGLWGGDKPGWHHNTKEYDADIGLVYMYMRWYNAETGAFESRDILPMEEATHPYSFAAFAPTRFVDPLGLDACDCQRAGDRFRTTAATDEERDCIRRCEASCATNAPSGSEGAYMSGCYRGCLRNKDCADALGKFNVCVQRAITNPTAAAACLRALPKKCRGLAK